jgi:hypothetical protein
MKSTPTTVCFSYNTECNRKSYTIQKCIVTKRIVISKHKFVTGNLSRLQDLPNLRPETHGHHWLVHCSRPIKTAYFTVVEMVTCVAVQKKPFSNTGSMVVSYELWCRSTYEEIHLQVAQIIC